MFRDIARDQASIRSQENAGIARWFSPSPMGLLFHGTDNTARVIAPDIAETRRHEGERIVEAFLDEMPAQPMLYMAMMFAGMVIAWCVADLLGLSKSGATPAGFGLGALAAHGYEFWAVLTMRQKLYDLRKALTNDLRASVPVPNAVAAQYRRHNPFQTALMIVIGAFGLFAMVAMHDESLLTAIPIWIYIVFVPLAWGLFALARYRDAQSGVTRRKL